MEKKCQRCGGSFECKNDDILNCQCATVRLSQEARTYMAERYTDCICVDCLNEIGEQFPEPGIAWLRINT